jgi:hypothetical protein
MKLLAIALGLMAMGLAGCESPPPQGPRSLLEQTTITDESGTRVEKPAFLTPQALPPAAR